MFPYILVNLIRHSHSHPQESRTEKIQKTNMVLNKAIKVLRRWRPTRSVLLESKYIPEEALLFESGSLAVLSKSIFSCSILYIINI